MKGLNILRVLKNAPVNMRHGGLSALVCLRRTMGLYSRKRLGYVVFAAMVFMSSCAEYEKPGGVEHGVQSGPLPTTGPAILEVSPWAVEVTGSGDTEIVFVKVMDSDKRPLADQTVFATIEDTSVAFIEDHEVTDKKGLARFTVTGVGMPTFTKLTFTAGSVSTKIDVWKMGYGPYGRE